MAANLENLIQCGLNPKIPAGLKILPEDQQLTNRIMYPIEWNPIRARLHSFPEQRKSNNGLGMEGMALLGALDALPVLGPIVWDSFLKRKQERILITWKEDVGREYVPRHIWFPGTLYGSATGEKPIMRGIYWNEDEWKETTVSFSEYFNNQHSFATWME